MTLFEWPDDASARARFVVPTGPAACLGCADNDDDNINNGVEQSSYCRIEYHRPSGVIRVVSTTNTTVVDVSSPNDDVQGQGGGGGALAAATTTEVLDEFDPADVIGAELEIKFLGGLVDALTARLAASSSYDDASSAAAAAAAAVAAGERSAICCPPGEVITKEEVEDVATRKQEEEAEGEESKCPRFQDTDDFAGMLLPPRPTEEEESTGGIGVAQPLNCARATAFLNVYCYPRRREEDGWLGWLNPFSSPSLPAAGKVDEKKEGGNSENGKGKGRRYAHHRRYEVAPCFDFADARAIVRAIRRVSGLGQFDDAPGSVGLKGECGAPRSGGEKDEGATTAAVTFVLADKEEEEAVAAAAAAAVASSSRPRRYLLVANPHSGTGRAKRIYEDIARPMLDQAGVEHDVVFTRYGGHARELMSTGALRLDNTEIGKEEEEKEKEEKEEKEKGGKSSSRSFRKSDALEKSREAEAVLRDVKDYDGVVVLGGDGTLFEILQGVHDRPDFVRILAKVAFGVIGCGSSNGLAKSVLHQQAENYGPLESTFLICKGQCSPIDLSQYEVRGGKTYRGFLTFSWAFIADVDLDSECIRFMGSTRMDLWAAYRILAKKSYRARFSYLPGSKVSDKTKPVQMPALDDPLPPDWVTIEGDFILFWASQVSHAAFNTFQSPLSQLQDGLFHVMVVRNPISRAEMIKMFLSIESGGHVKYDKCEQYDCVAYRLCPLEEGSHNDLDGEKIESGPIQAHVLPASMLFFSGTAS